jgi:hypothetical protein
MKDKLLILILGILIGSIITSLVYNLLQISNF